MSYKWALGQMAQPMIFANLLFYLLLPHALGSGSTAVGQTALCLLLFLNGLYLLELKKADIYKKGIEALTNFVQLLVVPIAIIALLTNYSQPEQWTLHTAILLLPMAMTSTVAVSGESSGISTTQPSFVPVLESP
jgi:hypothetical protein